MRLFRKYNEPTKPGPSEYYFLVLEVVKRDIGFAFLGVWFNSYNNNVEFEWADHNIPEDVDWRETSIHPERLHEFISEPFFELDYQKYKSRLLSSWSNR